MVGAWATENGLLLGGMETDSKSNEIKTIPRLLELLELKGCIVTIDAAGCHKEIAEKVMAHVADPLDVLSGDFVLDGMGSLAAGVQAGLAFGLVAALPLAQGWWGNAASTADELLVAELLVEFDPSEAGAEGVFGVIHGCGEGW